MKKSTAQQRKLHYDLFVVLLLAFAVLLMASLATWDPADPVSLANFVPATIYKPDNMVWPMNESVRNACGPVGALVSDMLYSSLGYCAWFLVAGLIALELALLRKQAVMAPWMRTAGWMLSLIGLSSLAALVIPAGWSHTMVGPGGYLGALTSGLLKMNVATTGAFIATIAITVSGLMMWTEYLIFRAGRVAFAPAVVAATAMLPFGLLHRFVKWFNRRQPGSGGSNIPDFNASREDDEEEMLDGSDLPRRIRINRRDDDSIDTGPREEIPILVRKRSAVDEAEDVDAVEIPESSSAETVAFSEGDDLPDEDTVFEEIEEGEILAGTRGEVEAEPVDSLPEKKLHARPHFRIPESKKPPQDQRQMVMNALNAAADADAVQDYVLPAITLLNRSEKVSYEEQQKEALAKAEVLEKTCAEFGYRVKVVEIEPGPAISQYEIQLEAGLRLNKITALADDLAIALRVPSVRIVAPIPGKNTVGVEVPNETRELVRLRDVIERSEAKTKKMKIPLFLGKDAVGAPMVVDLAALPHLLIAGRTGTGKSVCLNSIITSILMTRTPDEVRMLMIDPKMVELSGYARLPHLMHPVVTDMKKAEAILAWAVDKMEERYALLAKVGVRHVTSFNQLGAEEIYERMGVEEGEARSNIPVNLPFIVIVADEMADLMMTAGKEVEQHIIRLAQKSRAVGIHLILATQKPTVDVITGLIKSNLPARIAFQVASKMDSRVVLDAMGADKLLGNGDMLFLWPGTSTLLRGQGTYLSDAEIEAVTEAVSTGEQSFVQELMHIKVDPPEGAITGTAAERGADSRDDLYNQAVEIVLREGRGSCSLLQRALRIGYGRASRLIDFMAEDGLVGEYNGSNAREVLVTLEQWQNGESGGSIQPARGPGKIEPLPEVGRGYNLAASDAASPPRSRRKVTPQPPQEEPEEDDENDEGDEEHYYDAEMEAAENDFESADDDFEYEDVDDEDEDIED